MIFFKRRRLLTWLIKAYLKKHGKTILLFFIAGLAAFLFLILTKDFFIEKIPFTKKQTIGMVGSYDVNSLPFEILQEISYGLTSVSVDGEISPAAALSWKIDKGGKEYTFYLKKNVYFTDGARLSSKDIKYGFSDVSVSTPDESKVVFLLKDNYSPFLVTVSRPIFKKGFVGLSNYKVNNLKLNGNFVESIELLSKKDKSVLNYQFYPTEEALKSAFVMGEISRASGLSDISFKNTNFSKFKSVDVRKDIDKNKLVTLFYNTKDSILSDNRIRKALTYALPDTFSMGQRNSSPFSPDSWAKQSTVPAFAQDFDHSRLLLSESSASSSASLKLKIKTLLQYKKVADEIVDSWRKINIVGDVEVVDSIPSSFQVFLGDFNLSKDPDEYPLWHSDQPSNISHYKNLRIDKLLEDGRKEIDIEARKKIYANFEKYLLDDSPASFLFLPYSYDVSR